MNTELLEALNILEEEKDISKETLLDAIENSLINACKNHFGKADNIKVIMDRENHASLYDGCRLSYGKMLRFRHNDMSDLEKKLQKVPDSCGCLIVTDGVFSMGGDIAKLLSALSGEGACPKTILYSLNPADNQQLDTMLGCFQSDEIPGKIQHGSAWWFNDTKSGMEEQMRSLANLGLLGTFVGMLTDSRSFLSYARHDYFRRILCNLIGHWVENGEYPNDEQALKKIVEGVCYKNAERYFNL